MATQQPPRRPQGGGGGGDDDLPGCPSSGLRLDSMLKASPQHHGKVLKLHVNLLYSVLPLFLQTWILRIPFLLSFLAPKWKQRYLILLGSYVYKFSHKAMADPAVSADKTKGTPIPTESIHTHILQQGPAQDKELLLLNNASDVTAATALGLLPPEYTAVFVITTARKSNYYAVTSRDDATAWVNSLRLARQEAVTRSMGHAPVDSYPKAWSYFDSLGQSLVKTNERIRRRMEQQGMREMEMSSLSPGGGLASTAGIYA